FGEDTTNTASLVGDPGTQLLQLLYTCGGFVDPPFGVLRGLPYAALGLAGGLGDPRVGLVDRILLARVGLGDGLPLAPIDVGLGGRLLLRYAGTDLGGLVTRFAHSPLGFDLAVGFLFGEFAHGLVASRGHGDLEVLLDLVAALLRFLVETIPFCLGVVRDRLRLVAGLLEYLGVFGLHLLTAVGEFGEQFLVACAHRAGVGLGRGAAAPGFRFGACPGV